MALTAEQNAKIAELQTAYKNATTDAERESYHNQANAIRTSAGQSTSWGESDGLNAASSSKSASSDNGKVSSSTSTKSTTPSVTASSNNASTTNTKTVADNTTVKQTKIINPDGTEGTGYIIDGYTYTDPNKNNRISTGTSVLTDNGWYTLTENGSVPSSSTSNSVVTTDNTNQSTDNTNEAKTKYGYETIEDAQAAYTEAKLKGDWETMEKANRAANILRGNGDVLTAGEDIANVKAANQTAGTGTGTTYDATNWQSAPADQREAARRTPALVGYTKSGQAIYQTTVDDMNGIRTGYIINGECYYDKDGTQPINSSAKFYTSAGTMQKTSSGEVIDYTEIENALKAYESGEITEEELDELAYATYGEEYEALIGKNSESTTNTSSVSYEATSITPSSEEVSASISGMNATDATQYIISLYEQSAESALQKLKTSYDNTIQELDESVAEIKAISQTYKNSIASQNQLALLNLNEELAASGLSSGAAMQMRLSINNTYQQKMSDFELEEAQQLEALERDRANAYTDYQNAVAQAVIDNDLEKANALYEEYIRQDNARIQATATALEYAYKYDVLEQEQEQFEDEMAYDYEALYAKTNSSSDGTSTSYTGSGGNSDYAQAIIDMANASSETEAQIIATDYLMSTGNYSKGADLDDLIAAMWKEAQAYQQQNDEEYIAEYNQLVDRINISNNLSDKANTYLESIGTYLYNNQSSNGTVSNEVQKTAEERLNSAVLKGEITDEERTAILKYFGVDY